MAQANTKTTTRKRAAPRPKLQVVPPPVWNPLMDLEAQICDLDRAARIAGLMAHHDLENEGEKSESLAIIALENVQRLASELRASFYLAADGKAVRT
jgi:hypothetical protein